MLMVLNWNFKNWRFFCFLIYTRTFAM